MLPSRPAIGALQRACSCYVTATRSISSGPSLRLFLCAPDASSDRVGAALICSLKKLFKGQLNVEGLAACSEFALAEKINRLEFVKGVKHHKDLDVITPDVQTQSRRLTQLVLTALDGLPPVGQQEESRPVDGSAASQAASTASSSNSGTAADIASKQQQQQGAGPGGSSLPAPGATSSLASHHSPKDHQQQQQQEPGPEASGRAPYDAIITIGGRLLNKQLLGSLRVAQRRAGAQLPPLIAAGVPGLGDFQSYRPLVKAWARDCDHVICTLPFQPALFSSTPCPASFTGHPIVQLLLEQQQQQQQQEQQRQQGSSRGSGSLLPWFADGQLVRHMFLRGDGRGFRQQHAQVLWPQLVAEHSSSSSSSRGGRAAAVTAEATAGAGAEAAGVETVPLLLLLPGEHERELKEAMAAFDIITRQLAGRQPHLAAVMVVPALWVPLAREAVANFSLPVVVVDQEQQQEAADAAAAATAGLSHAGEASLLAVASGVPLVALRLLSPLRHGLAFWRSRAQLLFTSLPNLVAGQQVVPEVVAWGQQGLKEAEEAVGKLLAEPQAREQQVEGLQAVISALLPPNRLGSSSAVQMPSDAAASILLQLLEQQHSSRRDNSNKQQAAAAGAVEPEQQQEEKQQISVCATA